MRAVARVRAVSRSGRTAFETLRSDPPLLLRPCGDELHLVGGAAGPLGGDQLAYELDVGDDAQLHVRTVAASVVLAGSLPSSAAITATVGAGAALDWSAQPLVSTARSRHRQISNVFLATDAVLRWREDVVWGRSEEPGGELMTRLRVEREGRAVLHQDLTLGRCGTAWDGPGALAGARSIASEVLVGLGVEPALEVITDDDGHAVACDLGGDAWLLQSIGRSHRRTVDRLSRLTRTPP